MNELNKELFELFARNAKTKTIMEFVQQHKEDLDPLATDQGSRDLLRLSALRGDHKLVKFFLEDFKINPNNTSILGVTALHISAQKGNVSNISTLLKHGAEINAKIHATGDSTPLMLATQKKQKAAIDLLAHYKGIDLEAEFANTHYTALHIAISHSEDMHKDWVDIVRTLVHAGASMKPIIKTNDLYSITDPMHLAINAFNPDIVSLLLELGYRDTDLTISATAPSIALTKLSNIAEHDQHRIFLCTKILSILINSKNIELNLVDVSGMTPLILAFSLGSVGISAAIQMIQNDRCDFTLRDKNGKDIYDHIKEFLQFSSDDTIKKLFLTEKEAQILLDFVFPDEISLKAELREKLTKLSGNYMSDESSMLADAFGFLSDKNMTYMSEEYPITRHRMLEHIIEYICNSSKGDLEKCTDCGWTLLQIATYKDCLGIVQMLLDKGVVLDSQSSSGDNIFHVTMMQEVQETYWELFIEHLFNLDPIGTEVSRIFNMRNDNGETILHTAIKNNVASTSSNYNKIRTLLNSNLIDINMENSVCLRPIDIALLNKDTNIISEILIHEPDLSTNSQNLTPLHYAASIGNIYSASLIYGKFPEALSTRDNEGRTPLHHAAQNLHLKLIGIFAEKSPEILKAKDYLGYTIFHQFIESAECEDWAEVAKIFHDKELLYITNNDDLTPMELGAFIGKIDIVRSLFIEQMELTPTPRILALAVSQGHINLIKYLVDDLGMDLSQPDEEGCTPFFNLVYLYSQLKFQETDIFGQERLKVGIKFMLEKYRSNLGLEHEYNGATSMDLLRNITKFFGEHFTNVENTVENVHISDMREAKIPFLQMEKISETQEENNPALYCSVYRPMGENSTDTAE
jgi:ankyrin repeat protein